MIPDITELNFPKIDGKQYATLTHASIPQADMGEKTITTQVKIDGDIVPDFSFDWAVEFQGEKYIMPLRIPAGLKDNEKLKSQIDLTFQHWAIYQLRRWPFVVTQQIEAGTYSVDEEVATVQLNLGDFCNLLRQVLLYYYGETITIDLNPAWRYKQEATTITISHTKIWNVLTDTLHGKYGVRWEIKAASDNSNTVKGGERYVIRVGYPTTEVDHIFEYGFEGGLLKLERQVQSEEIRNMLKGRGGDTNIPFRYFKNTDPDNPEFEADPDWVDDLANIYFPNLMPATFRSYVQGWKAAHISDYPGYVVVGEDRTFVPWAYRKGYTDTKFQPVEFVADEITINPTTGDKQVEIFPGYSPYVKKGSSLDKYGPLPDTLDNNDDIYPTLQGTGLDVAIAVEQIESDDVSESTESDAQISDVKGCHSDVRGLEPSEYRTVTLPKTPFDVEAGKTANLITDGIAVSYAYVPGTGGAGGAHNRPVDIPTSVELVDSDTIVKVYDAETLEERSPSGIPAGNWYYEITVRVHNMTTDKTLNVGVSLAAPKKVYATLDDKKWRGTFNLWVKNIWSSSKLPEETDSQYSERVWKPRLGDRDRNTAKVLFTSGALAHEDYEFTIVDFPTYDTSMSYDGSESHWRIPLAKSDAELKATGLYVPSTKKQGAAGNTFVFLGTELTHYPYVTEAEILVDNWQKDQLYKKKEIKPTAVVTTDRVRLSDEGKPDALINQLRVGNSIRLFDKRFFNEEGKAYETLYLQSITYIYREPTSDDAALNPDVEIVLGTEYTTSANPVSMMQGEISALQRQVGSISNVEQIVRAVGDRLYLRKDGISDRSLSPTQFFSLLTSGDFRAGLIGGTGWGFYKDENGNWVLEADRINVRQEMQVNTLVINQAEGRGGMEIDTAAYIEGVTRVVETDNGYVCYFDQKNGSVANLFHVDDIAFCSRWTPENTDLKFYKRRVTAVSADSITLSKTDVNGAGTPAEGDNIIHFGNYTDATRQYVKVRDVVGGGYERYIEALNSVNAAGVEYYFVGKQAGQSRWFVGNKDLVPYSGAGDGSYIEYINRKFNLNNVSLSVNTTIGDKTLEEYIKLVSPPVEQEDIEGFVNAIVDPKLEGIQNQIDGVIETWFYNGVPTLTNYPANGWNTTNLKKQHLGDLYYDNNTGTAYRFSQNAQGAYYWNTITDDAITKALAAAQKAQTTADGKRRVFTAQPTADQEYDQGDLWVNATYGTQYSNDILRCTTHKDSGTAFNILHWTLASKYTDDSALNTFIQRYETEINGFRQQVDGKMETWYYPYDPSLANAPANGWDADAKAAHSGDLFYNTTTKKVFRWTGAAWEPMTDPDIQAALDAASGAQDTADNKRRVFLTQPTVPYDKGDLWIVSGTNGRTLKVCIEDRAEGEAYKASDWETADDAALNNFANLMQNSLAGIKDQLDGKAETWYQAVDPSTVARPNGWLGESASEHKGDLWYCTADIAGTQFKKGTTWYWNGAAWEKQDIPQSVFDTIDGKADIFVSKPTGGYHTNDLWFLEADYVLSGIAYKQGTLVVAVRDMGPNGWSANDWIKKDNYTDDTLAQQAKNAADAAQAAADAAQDEADAAKDRLDAWAADGVISPTEKQSIRDEIARINADKKHIEDSYTLYVLGTPTAYTAAYTAYWTVLQSLTDTTVENIPIPSDFAAKQTAYYTKRSEALKKIAETAKKYAEDIAKNEAEKVIADYKYLKEALLDKSTTIGGVFLSSYIRLGKNNADLLSQTVWSGLSGVYSDELQGRSISYWAGGEAVDLFKADDTRKTEAELAGKRPAQALVRMDGSYYLSGGNIGGRLDGSAWFGGENGLRIDEHGTLIMGNGVQLDFEDGTQDGIVKTLESMVNFQLGLKRLLQPCDANDEEIDWAEAFKSDGTPNGILAKSLKAKVGLWSTGFISALGKNDSASVGGGGAAYNRLDSWSDYDSTKAGYVLSAALGYDLYQHKADVSALSALTSRVSVLESKNYLDALVLSVVGSGNAVTAVSLSADKKTLTVNKGATYALATSLANYYTKSETDNGFLHTQDNMKYAGGLNSTTTYAAYRIKTTWPATSGYNGMPTINIRGYAYGVAAPIDIDIVTYRYDGAYLSFGAVSKGGWRPEHIYITAEDGVAVIYLVPDTPLYFCQFHVFVYRGQSMNRNFMEGWTVEALSAKPTVTADMKEIPWKTISGSIDNASKLGGVAASEYLTKGNYASVLSSVYAPLSHTHTFASLTSKPTTIAGYGITDAYTKGELDTKFLSYLTTSAAQSTYVSALGVSGNYLTWTKNGAVNNITVPYATESLRFKSTILNNADDLNTFRLSGLYHSTQTSVCASLLNGPSGRTNGELWFEVRNVGTSGYGSQLLFTRSSTVFEYWVRTFNSSGAFSAWQKFLTDTNYSSILDSRYYTESEVNAKLTDGSVTKVGTANVGSSIKPVYLAAGVPTACAYSFGNASGNAALNNGTLCTNLNADMLDGVHATSIFKKNVNLTSNADAFQQKDLGLYFNATGNGTGNTNFPSTYGIMPVFSFSDSYIMRLHAGSDGRLCYQTKFGSTDGAWQQLARITDNVASATNADMLDGAHADDIRKSVMRFKQFTGTSTAGGYDLNTLAPDGGLITNYGGIGYWGNAPQNASYGIALHFPSTGYTLGGQLFADINHNSATDVTRTLWWRASGTVNSQKTWGKWHQIAFTDSNVDSATKLATARTIWGQNFDGTANVTGALTSVTSITMSGVLYMGENNINSGTDYISLLKGSMAQRLLTGGLLVSGTYSDRTKIPSYGAYISGQAVVGSLKIGEVTISYDASNGGLHVVGGGLYSDSYISAKGSNSDTGSGGGGGAFGLMRSWPAADPGESTNDALGANLGFYLYKNKADLTALTALTSRVTTLEGKEYVTSLGISGNYLTWTKNGAVNNITVPYAKESSLFSPISKGVVFDANTVGSTQRISYYNTIHSGTTNIPYNIGWQSALLDIGLHGNGTSAQLYFTLNHSMYFRPNKTESWRTILDSANTKISDGTITINGTSITPLTQHQNIYSLTIQRNGVTVDTFDPNGADKTINLSDIASAATLSAHTSNSTIHITASERTAWNNKVDKVSGKGLSANDFTDALLSKLNGIAAGANKYVLPTAGASVLGGVKIGDNITISNGVISTHAPYVHPTATATTIAAASGKVLSAITVNGLGHVTSVSSKTLASADIPALPWSKITSGKPTTLAGYGITDAVGLYAEQDIAGWKTFLGGFNVTDKSTTHNFADLPRITMSVQGWCYSKFVHSTDDRIHLLDGAATSFEGMHKTFVAGSFVKYGGTANQFLKADGSVGDLNVFKAGNILANRISFNNGQNFLEWDYVNNAFKVNGNLYATGWLSCLGFSHISAKEVAVTSIKVGDAVFTQSGGEIYVTISSTRYKLLKTAA